MFAIDPIVLAIVALAAVAAGAVAYSFLFTQIEVERKVTSRVHRVSAAETDRGKVKDARDRVAEVSKRRKSVQDSLKQLEDKQKERDKKAASIKEKLVQAGLSLSMAKFYMISAGAGVFSFLGAFILSGQPLVALGAAFVLGLGLPRWVVGFLVTRRQKKFLNEFPVALDVMVRSIKSGLPLNDALRLIANDSQEPVKGEFRRVVESQQLGFSVPEACTRMHNTMPLQEVSFFSIVIAIQGQAGGNLSEALANLSRVLRDRKKMRSKVSAMSMEAKASAAIIGALPFIVMLLVYLTSPQYIMLLFTDPRGHLILAASGVWMSIGIFIMRKMINFDI